jgi:hypothetical protein
MVAPPTASTAVDCRVAIAAGIEAIELFIIEGVSCDAVGVGSMTSTHRKNFDLMPPPGVNGHKGFYLRPGAGGRRASRYGFIRV